MNKINVNLLISKRTAEISLDDMKGLTYMEALQKAKREFDKGNNKHED